nr:unnamed protein product [Digitaria exilis]
MEGAGARTRGPVMAGTRNHSAAMAGNLATRPGLGRHDHEGEGRIDRGFMGQRGRHKCGPDNQTLRPKLKLDGSGERDAAPSKSATIILASAGRGSDQAAEAEQEDESAVCPAK